MIIAITGGTGTVGSHLAKTLRSRGHEVRILTRDARGREGFYSWDPVKGLIDETVLENCDAIVHLAGSSVAAGRWTKARKKEILHSRVDSAQLLYRVLEESDSKLSRIVSASAIGYYGHQRTEVLTEDSTKGVGFLADVCDRWEESADRFKDHGAEVLKARIGIVMSKEGGFVERVSKLIRMVLGAVLGSGKQITSWIHIDDLVNLLADMAEGKLAAGAYNAVSPQPVEHRHIIKGMSKRLNRPILLPNAPKFALQLLFGELSKELLSSQNVSAQKLLDSGFEFKYPNIDQALDAIYSGLSSSES